MTGFVALATLKLLDWRLCPPSFPAQISKPSGFQNFISFILHILYFYL